MGKVKETDSKVLYELMLVVGLSLFLFFYIPSLAWVYTVLPFSYLIIERRIRHRSLESLGVKREGIVVDIRKNFLIIILVAIGIQCIVIVGSYWLWTPLFLRFEDRVTYLQAYFGTFAPLILFLPLIGFSTLLEELVFRGFVQERSSWFCNDYVAIFVGAFLMSLFHYSSGEPSVITVDLFLVFLDSFIYGVIYLRSRNVFASWTAHLLADLVGVYLIWIL